MPHGIRDMLGSLLSVVHLEAPPPLEQLAILEASFPDLQPLLPTALAMLHALLPEPHTRFLPSAPLLPVCSLIVLCICNGTKRVLSQSAEPRPFLLFCTIVFEFALRRYIGGTCLQRPLCR